MQLPAEPPEDVAGRTQPLCVVAVQGTGGAVQVFDVWLQVPLEQE